MLERGVVLEHEADVALLRRQAGGVDALDLDRAAVGVLEPGDDPQQRRLAAAARAEQRGELTGRDVDRHVVEGDEVAEALVDVADLDAHRVVLLRAEERRRRTMHERRRCSGEHERRRRRRVALLRSSGTLLDEQRGRLRLRRSMLPDTTLHRAELAERAGQAEHDAVDERPPDRRQGDPPERLARVAPRVRAACSCSMPISSSTGTTSRTTSGSDDEHGGQDHARAWRR